MAAVSISQSRQSVQVEFTHGLHAFSPSAFRDSLREAGVEVLSFQVDACGVIERRDSQVWLTAGKERFLLMQGGTSPGLVGQAVCVSGRLNDRSDPQRLEIIKLDPL